MPKQVLSINTPTAGATTVARMKTSSARRFVRIQGMVMGLALLGMVGMAFSLGESLAVRFERSTVRQAEVVQAPNIDMAVLVAAFR